MGTSASAPWDPSRGFDGSGSGRDPSARGLLTINEIAAALRVSKMTVYRFIRDGRLPAIRVGSSLRVYRDDLDTYLSAAFLPR